MHFMQVLPKLICTFVAWLTINSEFVLPCKVKVKIKDCPPTESLFPMMTYSFNADVDRGCVNSKFIYKWAILDSDSRKLITGNLEKFIIPEFSLVGGKYIISLNVEEFKASQNGKDSATCFVEYITDSPVAGIQGGDIVTYPLNKIYTVDGSMSINFENNDLQPIWSVACTKQDSCSLPESFVCPNPGSATGLLWNFNTQSCSNYDITLKLKYGDDPAKYPTHRQSLRIVMDENIVTNFFRCSSNCVNTRYVKVRHRENTTLEVDCNPKCTDNMPNYKFEVKDTESNESLPEGKILQDAFSTKRTITIQERSLKPNRSYLVTGHIEGRPSSEYFGVILKTYSVIKVDCDISPLEGIALETIFKFDCSRSMPEKYVFRVAIYQPQYEKGPVVMHSSFRVFETTLGPSNGIFVGMTLGNTLYSHRSRYKNIKVTSKDINTPDLLNSLQIQSKTNNVDRVIQLSFTLLTDGSENLNEREQFQIKSQVLYYLNAVVIDNLDTHNYMNHIIMLMTKVSYTKDYAKRLKKFCVKVSKTTKFDRRYQDPLTQDKSQKMGISRCLKADLESNATLSDEDDITTTPYAKLIPDELVITEDYPNYEDEHIALEEAKEHDIIMQQGVFGSDLLQIGKRFKRTYDDSILRVEKYTPLEAYKNAHPFQDGEISYDKPFPDYKAVITVVKELEESSIITKSEDLATRAVDIITLSLNENDEKNEISPQLLIKFDNLKWPEIEIVNNIVTLPSNQREWSNETLNKMMSVHRLDVFEGHEIFIEFLDLEKDTKFKIALTKNARPNITHFKNVIIVDGSDKSTWSINPTIDNAFENCWIYIAILLHEDMLNNVPDNTNLTVNYSMKISSRSCIFWSRENRKWLTTECLLTSSLPTSMSCLCNHSSIFAGTVSNVVSKLDAILPMKIRVPLVSSLLVFYFVAIVFGAYCVTLCFSLKRPGVINSRENLFFLADNIKNDLYAYVLIVKTGNTSDAGTTSNIMIKLRGTKYESKAHVLNYPDPDKRLLQRDSEQWFVLATDQYMGSVTAIDVWFDSIGFRPTWYCDYIRVLDIQRQETYYFNVKLWLDVLKHTHFYTINASEETSFEWHHKFWNVFKYQIGGGNTWNIFSKSHDKNMSFIQRITVILSQILNVYVFAMLMYGSPEMRIRDGFSTGRYDYATIGSIAFGSGLLGFLFNIGNVTIFKHSNQFSDVKAMIYQKKLLPPWTNKLSWGILIANIHISLIYLVCFSFWLPAFEATLWAVSTTFAMLLNIFVFEIVFLSCEKLFMIYFSRKYKTWETTYLYDNIINEVENQRSELYPKFGENLLRPYFGHLYKVLSEDILEAKKSWNRLKLNVVFSDNQANIYRVNRRLGETMREGHGEYQFSLERIQTYDDIYDYIKHTVIPATHGRFWYGNWEIKIAGSMSDFANTILGTAQIRQQRTLYGECDMKIISDRLLCHKEHDGKSNHPNHEDKNKTVWTYQRAKDTHQPAISGTLRTYDGGGFIARLGRTEANSLFTIDYLRQHHWIDISTEVIIIDFWVYNANYNLFNVVQILIERSHTSFILTKCKVFTAHLLLSASVKSEIGPVICMMTLFCVLIVQVVRQVRRIVSQRWSYFKDFWNYYDWALILITIFVIAFHIGRSNMVERVLSELNTAKNNDFVLYFHLIHTSKSLVLLSAFVICLTTLRIWKYLRFWTVFTTLERTLRTSALPLLVNAGYVLIFLLAYSSMGFLLYGGVYSNMNTFFKITATLFVLSLGFDELDSELETSSNNSSYFEEFYRVSFLIITFMIYNVITTIIMLHLEDSKQFYSNVRQDYSIFDYAKDEYRYLKEMFSKRNDFSFRLRAGSDNLFINSDLLLDEDKPMPKVYPKSIEHRYAKSELLSKPKMKSMAIIAQAIIQRKLLRAGRILKDEDYTKMAAVVLDYKKLKIVQATEATPDDSLLFYVDTTCDGHVSIVCEHRLQQIEYVVNRLLDGNNLDINAKISNMYTSIGDAIKLKNIHNNLQSILLCIENIKIRVE